MPSQGEVTVHIAVEDQHGELENECLQMERAAEYER